MSIIRCPVCGGELTLSEKAAACALGHSFDRAKQGYFNLLSSNQSSDKRHGDDKLMLLARREFLGAGHYEKLRNAVADELLKYAPDSCSLLDAGCGEGYYTEGMFGALSKRGAAPEITAVDISKDAAKITASRSFPKTVIVASAFALPVMDESCDMVTSIFAPVACEEFSRVLKSGGVLIRVVPRERHLFGLKEQIYDKPYLNPPVLQALPGFEPISLLEVDFELELNSQKDITALFKMTPYYYKTSKEDQQKAERLTTLKTELSFAVMTDKKA